MLATARAGVAHIRDRLTAAQTANGGRHLRFNTRLPAFAGRASSQRKCYAPIAAPSSVSGWLAGLLANTLPDSCPPPGRKRWYTVCQALGVAHGAGVPCAERRPGVLIEWRGAPRYERNLRFHSGRPFAVLFLRSPRTSPLSSAAAPPAPPHCC